MKKEKTFREIVNNAKTSIPTKDRSFRMIRALSNATRFKIYKLLEERQCLSFYELMKDLGIDSRKRLRYHLEMMKDAELVEEKSVHLLRKKRSKRFFFINMKIDIRSICAEKPILDVPLTMDDISGFLARFEEQRKNGMIPEEIVGEITEKIRLSNKLRKLHERISSKEYRA